MFFVELIHWLIRHPLRSLRDLADGNRPVSRAEAAAARYRASWEPLQAAKAKDRQST